MIHPLSTINIHSKFHNNPALKNLVYEAEADKMKRVHPLVIKNIYR